MPKLTSWIFFIALFLVFLLPPTDPDLGWQLKCGELFWRRDAPLGRLDFCEDNQFSVLLEDYSWPNHAWGYQATIYPIWSAFGGWGLTIFNALLMMAAFGFLFAAIKNRTLEKMLAILATIHFGWGVFSFGIRSQLMGFFFFTLTLWLLTRVCHSEPRACRGTKNPSRMRDDLKQVQRSFAHAQDDKQPKKNYLLYAALPLTMLLWANTHGSVILGLILVFSSVIPYLTFRAKREVLIDQAIAYQIKHDVFLKSQAIAYQIRKNFKNLITTPLLASSLLTVGATLINPFGFKIYEEMWRHFSGPIDLSQLIAEWVPPQPQIQQIIIISGTFVLIYLMYRTFVETGHAPSLPFILNSFFLILPFAFWALRARRNVPFHFVILSYSLLNSLKTKISPLRNQLAALLAIGVLLYGLIVQVPKAVAYDDCQRDVPCKAVEFLKEQEPGPIFNRYEWGGFLIWHLPEHKIFVDGRMPAWGESVSPYTVYLETLQTRPGWQKTLDQYNITYILISPNTFMDLKLRPNPQDFGWQEIFRNKNSVAYSRQSPTPPTP